MKFGCLARALIASVILLVGGLPEAIASSRSQNAAAKNDNFAGAIPLSPSSFLTLGHTYNASRELGEPKINASSIGRTVWYKFTASKSGRVVVAAASPDDNEYAPIQFAVYRGTAMNALTRLGSVQVAGQEQADSGALGFDAVAKQTYYIQVDSAPSSSYYRNGYFMIGLAQFGTTGGLATFLERPLVVLESGYSKRVLVVNGFKNSATIQYALTNLSSVIDVAADRVGLGASKTSWYYLSEDDLSALTDTGATRGTLQLTARSGSTTILGTASIAVTGVKRDYANAPILRVRFAYPGLGVRLTDPATSAVVVKNVSSKTAQGCWFSSYDVYGVRVSERLASGSYTNLSSTFDLTPGQTRRFQVSSYSGSTSSDEVYVVCANYYAEIGDDYFSSLSGYSEDGQYFPRVLIDPVTSDDLRIVPIRDFQSRKVIVKLTNNGGFSGDFTVSLEDDEYLAKAVVDSFCESNSGGTCIGTADPDTITVNIAVGETKYVGMTVRRGSELESGFVRLTVRTSDDESPSYALAGYGGFEVVRQP